MGFSSGMKRHVKGRDMPLSRCRLFIEKESYIHLALICKRSIYIITRVGYSFLSFMTKNSNVLMPIFIIHGFFEGNFGFLYLGLS